MIGVSSDDEAHTREVRRDWGLENTDLAYGLPADVAEDWGVALSSGIDPDEPGTFNEPALFLVRPDGSLFGHIRLTSPFGRPRIEDVLAGIDAVIAADEPLWGDA